MTREEAAEWLAKATREYPNGRTSIYFDYLKGRVMKVELAGDDVDPWLYDRDNGQGAFARVIDELRAATKATGT